MTRLLSAAIGLAIRCYQYTFGAVLPGACRFEPSCSNYALEAVERHGPARGCVLVLRRLARCHPFGGSGFDPVPERRGGADLECGEIGSGMRAVQTAEEKTTG